MYRDQWSGMRIFFASSKFLDPYLLCDFFVANAFVNSIENFMCLCFQPWFKIQHGSVLLCTFILTFSIVIQFFRLLHLLFISTQFCFHDKTTMDDSKNVCNCLLSPELKCALKCKFTSSLSYRTCIWLS